MSSCAYDYDGGQTRYSQIKSRTRELEAEVVHLKYLLEQSESRRPTTCCNHAPPLEHSETSNSSCSVDSATMLPSLTQMFPDLPPPPGTERQRILLRDSSSLVDSGSVALQRRESDSPNTASQLMALDPLPPLATVFKSAVLNTNSTLKNRTIREQEADHALLRHGHRPLAPYPPSTAKPTIGAERLSVTSRADVDSQKRGRDQFVMDAQWQILRGDEDQKSFGRLDLPKATLTGCQEPCNHAQCKSPVRRRKCT